MHGLRPEELLRLFELGHGLGPLDRGTLLLAAAWPEASDEVRRALPIAERDRLLLGLRIATFGPAATVASACPDCETALETELDLLRLLAVPGPDDPFAVHALELGGRTVRFRLPSTADLESADRARNAESEDEARRRLVRSTLCPPASENAGENGEAGQVDDGEADPASIDDELLGRVAAAWDEIDPLSEVLLGFHCPDCRKTFDQVFDIVSFFYAELVVHARRLLLEIHALASAYGWTETEVLTLGPARRRLYVEMVS